MAWDATDWTITRNGAALDVRYIGDAHAGTAPTYVTTIELHRALGDFSDQEQDSGDDELSIIDQTPSDRGGADTNITLLNGCNLNDASIEHLYDGSITQDAGDTIYDGIQCFGNSTSIQVLQRGVRLTNDFWNEAKMITAVEDTVSSTTHRFLVKVRENGYDIDGRRLIGTQRVLGTAYTEFSIGGGTNRGNNTLALTANTDGNNTTIAGTIATWDTIANQVEGFIGISIGGTSYDFYSRWTIGSQSKNEFYERGKWIQAEEAGARDGDQILYGLDGDIFRGITHEIAVDTPTGTFSMVAAEEITWSGGTAAITAFADAGDTLHVVVTSAGHGLVEGDVVVIAGTTSYNGTFSISSVLAGSFEITDTWVADDATGTWDHQLGKGQLLAINSATAATTLWMQLLSGVVPTDGIVITGTTSSATVAMNVTITPRLIPATFLGTSTGTAINPGAFGIGILSTDLTQNDKVIDLTDTERTPPNNVTYTVNNTISGDYVIASNNSGGDFDFTQLSITNAEIGATVTSIQFDETISSDTPRPGGTCRVEQVNGSYRRITYTSITTTSVTDDTINFTSLDFSGVGAGLAIGGNGFITYIDRIATGVTETATYVYSSPRTLFLRVRNATPSNEIKTFETTSLVGAGGGSSTTGRIDDF